MEIFPRVPSTYWDTEKSLKTIILGHEEAVAIRKLLAYSSWFGAPNSESSNLAPCIWQSRAHAIAASSGEAHVTAMRLASSMYEIYSLERYVLKKVKGEIGVTVEDWAVGRKEVDF